MTPYSMFRSLVVLSLMLTMLVGIGLAQTSKGTITGVVTDASEAVVPGATVTAAATLGGETRTVTSGPNGAYIIPALTPGLYSVSISAQGFSSLKIEKVEVKAAVTTTANALLKVASTAETVTVEATSAQELQTISGELSHSITSTEITELPIVSLNPIALALTQPGVVSSANRDSMTNGVEFSVNGTRPRSNNFLMDGFDNNDSSIQGQSFQPTNLGAVGEVVVLTNSYAAGYGRGGGSVTNVTFKGGNNQFHGSAWELHQNSALDATDRSDKVAGNEKAPYRENTFGFTLGGPIKKDKLFIFGTYQWDRYRSSANGDTFRLPTEAGVQALRSLGDNPQVQRLLTAMGSLRGQTRIQNVSLGPDVNGNARPVVETGLVARDGVGQGSDDDQYNVRLDWLPTQKDTFTLRYLRDESYLTPDFFTNAGAFPGYDTMQGGTTHNLGLLHTHSFTPNVINEFRFSFGRIDFGFLPMASTLENPLALGPQVTIAGMFGYGLDSGYPQSRTNNTFQYQEALNWTKGTHTFKFGVDFARIYQFEDTPFNSRGTLNYTSSRADAGAGLPAYTALANFIDDYSGLGAGAAQRNWGTPRVRPKVFNQAYYVQDAWRIRPNFTLNYGVRYEYAGTPMNILSYPAIDFAAGPNQVWPRRVEVKSDKNNWAPRVSFAYTPGFWQNLFGEEKTVIRAGYGMYYDVFFNNILNNAAANFPNVLGGSIDGETGRGVANLSQQIGTLQPVVDPYALVLSMDSNLVAPITHQWNFDIQRELPGNFTLTTAYVGTRGIRLFVNDQLNPMNFDYATRVNDAIGDIRVRTNRGDSIYHGLNVKVDRRFTQGLLLRAAYTWSKAIDTGSEVFVTSGNSSMPQNVFDRSGERGLSAFDRRQRFVLTYVYTIPAMPKSDNFALKGVRALLSDWQISGTMTLQSGAPETVSDGFDANGDGVGSDRPNLGNPDAPITSYAFDGAQIGGTPGLLYDGPSFMNSDALVEVSANDVHWIIPGATNASNRYGNVGRNTILTDGTIDSSFSIARSFKLPGREGQQLQFRTELFNPFNHSNLGIPVYNLIDPDFAGRDITAYGSRQIRFWVKYSF